jgi:hypothetical protein
MMELHLGPGDVARLAVEQDDNGARLLLRMGNGRWRPLTPREFAELLVKGANEVDVALGRCICAGLTHVERCPERVVPL